MNSLFTIPLATIGCFCIGYLLGNAPADQLRIQKVILEIELKHARDAIKVLEACKE